MVDNTAAPEVCTNKQIFSSTKGTLLWYRFSFIFFLFQTLISWPELQQGGQSIKPGPSKLTKFTVWKPNVLRVRSTKTWKITSMWKFSFCEHLSSPHWPMSEPKFYPQIQILHRCVISSLWPAPTSAPSIQNLFIVTQSKCSYLAHFHTKSELVLSLCNEVYWRAYSRLLLA